MKLNNYAEPELEFGHGLHVCPRAGIARYDVYDTKFTARRDKILVGAVGTSGNLEKLSEWIQLCQHEIPGKAESPQPTLFPSFCGFNRDVGFRAVLVLEDEITRPLKASDTKQTILIKNWGQRVDAAVEMYYREIKFLSQHRSVDVIVCVLSNELYDAVAADDAAPIEETIEDSEPEDVLEVNFRRALKARAMHLGKPLQLVRELSLDAGVKSQQDGATKAWNFCTALYYKANQTVPWKLMSNINRPSVCYAGISFYRSRDRKILDTSMAQVFDELGNSVILRGTPVNVTKQDPRPHLSAEQAFELLRRALHEYEIALGTPPGRLVVHKTSNYSAAEVDGFRLAANELRVGRLDFITILDSDERLLRGGIYPPFRGTHVEFDEATHLLYTRGSVEYYRTYPGKYVPQPIEVRIVESDESAATICKEILGLTKMNWNNTQFDGKYPITIHCSRRVGQVLKYLGPDDKPQISYSFYM